MYGAVNATDFIVFAAAVVGALLVVTGLATFDPRIRSRLPVRALARGNAWVAAGLVAVGLLVVNVALG